METAPQVLDEEPFVTAPKRQRVLAAAGRPGAFKAWQQHSLPLFLDIRTSQAANRAASVKRSSPAGITLVPRLCDNEDVLALLRIHHVPCARDASERTDARCLTVPLDDWGATRVITDHLIELGPRRIGYTGGRLPVRRVSGSYSTAAPAVRLLDHLRSRFKLLAE